MSPYEEHDDENNGSETRQRHPTLYIVRELQRRVTGLERRVTQMHDQVNESSYWIKGGTQLFTDIKADLISIRRHLGELENKQKSWEVGGKVLYAVFTLAIGFIGWLVSKSGLLG